MTNDTSSPLGIRFRLFRIIRGRSSFTSTIKSIGSRSSILGSFDFLGEIMKKILLAILILIPITARAQNAVPTSKFQWNQDGPDLATVSAYTYKYYADGATTGVTFPTTTICSGTATPFVCTVNFPTFTQGNHSVMITASSAGGESPKSAPLAFTFISVPPAPTMLRLIP